MRWTSAVLTGAIAIALAMGGSAQAVNLVNPGFDAQNASGGDISVRLVGRTLTLLLRTPTRWLIRRRMTSRFSARSLTAAARS